MTALARSVGPSLRVVGLTYTGLLGILSLVAVIGVGLSPVSPTIQQVTQPARQAVTDFVQPTSDVVITLIGATPLHVVASPPLSETKSVAVTVAGQSDASLEEEIFTPDEPLTLTETAVEPQAAAEPVQAVFGPSPVVVAGPPQAADAAAIDDLPSDMPSDESEPQDMAPAEEAPTVIVQPMDTTGLRIATEETPQPLPTVQPETPAQIKARLDAENIAAIGVAREARARAKAEADAANQAAIDALKSASAAATAVARGAPAPAAVPTPEPTSAPVVEARPQPQAVVPALEAIIVKQSSPSPSTVSPVPSVTSKAAADAANQAAIDAAKAARARAKAEADAANQAAIAAARVNKTGAAQVTPVPIPPSATEPAAARTAIDAIAIDAPVADDLSRPEADAPGAGATVAEALMPEAAPPESVPLAPADMAAEPDADE
ncbi:MAG: hypothetical protein NVSMB2_03680 [Chloroflexota bacterium]